MSGLAASPLGALIGLLMGAFGGGGSLIAIPVLVYLVGQDVRAAQATSLVIVLIAAVVGLITHARRNEVRWRAGATFGAAAAASALAGSIVSRGIDQDLLLLLFSPVMLAGAAAMVSDRALRPGNFKPWKQGVSATRIMRVIALGLLVGWLIGLFGVGGGFVIVPVLVLALRLDMPEAVGTSLLVVVMGALLALGDRIESGDVDLGVAVPFSVAAALGALAGQRLADNAAIKDLTRAFAAVIALAALYTGVSSALGL